LVSYSHFEALECDRSFDTHPHAVVEQVCS